MQHRIVGFKNWLVVSGKKAIDLVQVIKVQLVFIILTYCVGTWPDTIDTSYDFIIITQCNYCFISVNCDFHYSNI